MTDVRTEGTNGTPPLSEERLRQFEEELGTTLPGEYRAFLQQHNGGTPRPAGFWVIEPVWKSHVARFYGLGDGPESLERHLDRAETRVPSYLLAIGEDAKGNFLGVGLRSSEKGTVYLLDNEIHGYADDPESDQGIVKLNESFQAFLEGLQELPR